MDTTSISTIGWGGANCSNDLLGNIGGSIGLFKGDPQGGETGEEKNRAPVNCFIGPIRSDDSGDYHPQNPGQEGYGQLDMKAQCQDQ